MKTRKEYIFDLELKKESYNKTYTIGELKSQYRKLVKKYHPDNGTEKNENKFKIISVAYDDLIEKKYKEEEIDISLEDGLKIGFDKIFNFVRNNATTIILNKNNIDSRIFIMDNTMVNLDWSELTEEKILFIEKIGEVFCFVKG